jgi:hypothetical protein
MRTIVVLAIINVVPLPRTVVKVNVPTQLVISTTVVPAEIYVELAKHVATAVVSIYKAIIIIVDFVDLFVQLAPVVMLVSVRNSLVLSFSFGIEIQFFFHLLFSPSQNKICQNKLYDSFTF